MNGLIYGSFKSNESEKLRSVNVRKEYSTMI